ncbi:hypothetical protein [Candidatus Nitrosocosmicus sp. R]
MDFHQNFTTTKLRGRIIFSFSLSIFLIAGMVILTSTSSVADGQVGILKPAYSITLRLILQETQLG